MKKALLAIFLLGCGGGTPVSGVSRPEPGLVREVLRIPGVPASANPVTGGTAPTEVEQTQVVRLRVDAESPVAARAIVIAYPGFLGGAGSFEGLARALVRESQARAQPIEVWAIDRRANLLEDLRGADAAETAGDPERALAYWFSGATEDGQRFAGFLDQDAVDYESEWGLAVHAEDLRNVIEAVPQGARAERVILLGHSLGAAFAEAYAARRFDDGVRGTEELAGLVLVDGVLGTQPLPESTYRSGGTGPFGPSLGLDSIRSTTRYQSLPFFGVELYARLEALALRAIVAPEAVTKDQARDDFLALALALPSDALPKMSNAAVLGLGLDRASNPFSFARASLGVPTGGLSTEYRSSLTGEVLSHPTEPQAVYGWDDSAGVTKIAELAQAFVAGRTNFAEWYFPARLALDLGAVGGGQISDQTWQAGLGLGTYDSGAIDVPVLAIAAGLISVDAFGPLRARVGGMVEVLDVSGQAHLDPVLADRRASNPVPDAVLAFIEAATQPGGVVVPTMKTIP